MGGRLEDLWMGDLDCMMDENFIRTAFHAMGETVLRITIIRNRYQYCFVEFPSAESAESALLRINGKFIPNADPPRRFKLNYSGKNRRIAGTSEKKEYLIFVGDLSYDVDDATLYQTFHSKYPCVLSAEVFRDNNGTSKGFGFVKFDNESEQQSAMIQMQHYRGCGRMPLRIGLSKKEMFGQYVSNSSAYSSNNSQYKDVYSNPVNVPGNSANYYQNNLQDIGTLISSEELAGLEEENPNIPLDIEGDNGKLIERANNLYIELDDCRWTIDEYLEPSKDNIIFTIPRFLRNS